MRSSEIRKTFLSFFEERGHKIVSSSSLLPDDPSVLLTSAGMQQFKPYFTGEANPEKDFGSHRTASIQKCFRTSDIDAVGDESHLTFFEMLGNFSFGPTGSYDPKDFGKEGYYKRSAIHWAWEFLNAKCKIQNAKLYITIFGGEDGIPKDEESFEIWKELGVPPKKIFSFGRTENFWGPTGEEGPCGPTTEIHYDLRGVPCEKNEECIPNCECGRFIELWNLVFNEYYQEKDKALRQLLLKGVDTGMGFERLVMICQGKTNIFATDLFMPLILEIKQQIKGEDKDKRDRAFENLFSPGTGFQEDMGKLKEEAERLRSTRILSDHMRGAAFLIADGVPPSNLGEGYVLRRLIRRSIRTANVLGLERTFYAQLFKKITALYEISYPELSAKKIDIITVFQNEEEKFARTLSKGMKEFEKMIENAKEAVFSAKDAFYLYETYGFPYEVTEDLAEVRGLEVSREDFEKEFESHQELSRRGQEKKFGGHGLILDTGELKAVTAEEVETVTKLHTATHLLHQALREALGFHVRQMGSDITAERLRFDFSHPQKMTPEEMKKVEDLVNEKIKADLTVTKDVMPYEKAIESGALAFFKAKYPSEVNVYAIDGFSREVCGGPHVEHTGILGRFRIVKEESSAAGVRRIRAVLEENEG